MRTLTTLIKRDFQHVFQSRPVLITLIAFCLVPAIYATLNIKVSWNPYAQQNTRRLPIAVVNNDEGSTVNGTHLNVGSEVTHQLKRNHNINWVLTNDWQGNNGLDQGKYYALIEIPNDFSSRLATLATDSPEKATLIYKSNEKLNPAATIITGQARDTLAQEIREIFTKIAGKEVIKQMNVVGTKINKKQPQILQIHATLVSAIHDINQTQRYLKRVDRNADDVQAYLKSIKHNIPRVSSQISHLEAVVRQGKTLAQETDRTATAAKSDLSTDLDRLRGQATQVQSSLGTLLVNLENHQHTTATNDELASLTAANQAMRDQINQALKTLDIINNILPNNTATALIKDLAGVKSQLTHQRQAISQLRQLMAAGKTAQARRSINQLNQAANSLTNQLDEAATTFTSNVSPSLDDLTDLISRHLSDNDTAISSLRSLTPQLQAVQDAGGSIAAISKGQVSRINQRLDNVSGTLRDLNEKAAFLNKKNLKQLVKLLGRSPQLANLLASPTQLKTTEQYHLKLFGYAAAPFYTVLSMWIGALLLTVILAWRYVLESKTRLHPNLIQTYVGKLTLFLGISLTQTTVTMISELLILGIRPQNVLAFLAIAYTTTLVFTIMTFSLVFLIGNAGKVIAVLLMIIQIFGTGGLYPLETIPHGLAQFAPFLPFTYAISGFREALGGTDLSVFSQDIIRLLGFAAIFIALACLKRLVGGPVNWLEKGMKRSQL